MQQFLRLRSGGTEGCLIWLKGKREEVMATYPFCYVCKVRLALCIPRYALNGVPSSSILS